MDTAITTTLIAGGSAIGGVMIKMAYDAVTAHLNSRRERANKFIAERKTAYDRFWGEHKNVVKEHDRLRDLSILVRAGKTVKPELIETFPDPAMPGFVAALEDLRRIAHTHDMVIICERIVSLHGSASAALRHYLDADDLRYGMSFFLANRLREDQELEFVAAYRKDLGIGPPTGVHKDWPTVQRPYPLPQMEAILHSYAKHGLAEESTAGNFPKPLTERDAALVRSPRFNLHLS